MILNFGHTFGHAFEKCLNYRKLLHGEAVSIGMVCAAELAVRLKIFSQTEKNKIVNLLKDFHLPVSLSGFDLECDDLFSAMARDKKKKGGKLRFILPVKIGKVVIRDNIKPDLLRKLFLDMGAK